MLKEVYYYKPRMSFALSEISSLRNHAIVKVSHNPIPEGYKIMTFFIINNF